MTPTVKVPQAMNDKAKKAIFYEDALSEIYSGDCREVLREMSAEWDVNPWVWKIEFRKVE